MVADIFEITGTTLSGAFLVEEVIAEGGFGVVYRAEHIAFRAKVALKCLKIPGMLSEKVQAAFVENFREEAETLFHLSAQIPEVVRPLHADVVVLPCGRLMPYLAMEWVDGTPLDAILNERENSKQPPLSLSEAVAMLTPVAQALERSHRFEVPGGATLSIAHCDLKPENILIPDHGAVRAKLLDFGIARVRELSQSAAGKVTDSETLRSFTPAYGAPEQWDPKSYGATGAWTDVWAMAITLVECITGRPPIEGSLRAMLSSTLDPNRRPTPRTAGAVVSDAIEEVFARALAIDPKGRYADVPTFWGDLTRAIAAGDAQRAVGTPPPKHLTLSAPDLDLTPGPRSVDDSGPGATAPRVVVAAAPRSVAPATHEPASAEVAMRFEMEDERPAATAAVARPMTNAAPAARPLAQRPAAPKVVSSKGRSWLATAGVFLALALALVALDVVMRQPGGPLAVAGIRVRWIGALAAGIGIVMALASFASSADD
ncbi:MAG: protein kinase [Deltaproteobacteria bacterium]|nr:protein kinase [Deltaproteobacteria bacterium]